MRFAIYISLLMPFRVMMVSFAKKSLLELHLKEVKIA